MHKFYRLAMDLLWTCYGLSWNKTRRIVPYSGAVSEGENKAGLMYGQGTVMGRWGMACCVVICLCAPLMRWNTILGANRFMIASQVKARAEKWAWSRFATSCSNSRLASWNPGSRIVKIFHQFQHRKFGSSHSSMLGDVFYFFNILVLIFLFSVLIFKRYVPEISFD